MLQLLQPVGLLTIAGIIFPVMIHLWNRREGKTLKIGSVALLAETARQQAKSLHIKDILLLLLRCLIIAVLALLLAKPVWQKQLAAKDQKGWILLPANKFSETYSAFKPQVDSLLAAGLELHDFNNEFPIIKLQDTIEEKRISTAATTSYWALMKQLNEQVPAELPVYLFTDNRLHNFSGNRPEVALNLHWETYAPPDAAAGYMVNARLSASDSITVVNGHSTALATSYSSQTIALQNPADAFRLTQQGEKHLIASVNSNIPPIEIDTTNLKIVIYTDQFAADAAYLKAALVAIKNWGKYNLQITTATTAGAIPQDCDWLFWLSQKELPASLQKNVVFKYEQGNESKVHSWVNVADGFSDNTEVVKLFRRIGNDHADTNMETVWSDGFGAPVLALETKTVYHFYSRFNPAWNELVWNEGFPQIIFNLLLKNELQNVNDKRMIAGKQLQPAILKKSGIKQNFMETTDLSKAAWVLAFLLFCLERFISSPRKKESHAR